MSNKKIYQFPIRTNPTGSELLPLSIGQPPNYSLSLSGLSEYVLLNRPDVYVTGGTYNQGTTTFTNNTGGTFNVSGFTTNVKHWLANKNKTIDSDETVVISGNYVLSGTNLTLNSDNLNINISGIDFNKRAQIFIGGYLLLIDSNIVNNGEITVGGAIIFSGNSTITGTGILN